jgi:hypothetical protein
MILLLFDIVFGLIASLWAGIHGSLQFRANTFVTVVPVEGWEIQQQGNLKVNNTGKKTSWIRPGMIRYSLRKIENIAFTCTNTA